VNRVSRSNRALRSPAGVVRDCFAEVVQHLLSADPGRLAGKRAIEPVGGRPEVGWVREVQAAREGGAQAAERRQADRDQRRPPVCARQGEEGMSRLPRGRRRCYTTSLTPLRPASAAPVGSFFMAGSSTRIAVYIDWGHARRTARGAFGLRAQPDERGTFSPLELGRILAAGNGRGDSAERVRVEVVRRGSSSAARDRDRVGPWVNRVGHGSNRRQASRNGAVLERATKDRRHATKIGVTGCSKRILQGRKSFTQTKEREKGGKACWLE
jgi:hypothetical protein